MRGKRAEKMLETEFTSPPRKLMRHPQCEECAIQASPRARSALLMN
jgi:hypothetical protein